MSVTQEQKALNISVCIVFVSAIFAFAMVFYTQSMAVVMDAAFSFLSAGLSALGALTVHFIKKGSTQKHPMGFYSYEVLITMVRSVVLSVMLVYLFIDAIKSIMAGGKTLPLGAMFFYILISGAMSLIAYFYVGRAYGHEPTLTLEIELNELRLDLYITVFIFISLLLALALRGGPWAWVVSYIDPGLVLFMCFFLIMEPILLLGDAFKHLTMQSAQAGFYKDFASEFSALLRKDFPCFTIGEFSVVPMGRMVWIYIEVIPCSAGIPIEQFRSLDEAVALTARRYYKHVDSYVYLGAPPF